MKKIKLKAKKKNENKKIKEKRSLWKTALSIFLVIAIFIVSIILAFALYIVIISPNFETEELYQQEPTVLRDINGNIFAKVGEANSTVITYDEMSSVIIDALVATEDSRFYQHKGIDLFRFIKASILQVVGKDDAGGASTLDMQLIKQTYTKKDKEENTRSFEGIVRKFEDVYMSVFKLEANYTKNEIIEFYLNSQWFANDGSINVNGIIGIEQGSQYFFGKSSKDLNLAEASLLVGMFKNPSTYNPYRNPKNCKNRQKTVLNLMVRHGYITSEERDAVLEIPIESLLQKHESNSLKVESYQAFLDYTLKEVKEKTGWNPKEVALDIQTTYDPSVQKVLEKVEKGEAFVFPNDTIQEGIAVTNVEDGSISAISGGRNYLANGTNRATDPDLNKQPGSTAKPIFDYAMYIQNISKSTYAMFLDEKTTYTNGQSISNYDNGYRGLITMRYALEDSRNIPALLAFKAVMKLNKKLIPDYVHSVGIDYGDELYESAAIGAFNGVSPLELSAAYGVFARGGYYIEPYSFTKVINTETDEEFTYSYTKEKVLEETTAFMINNILVGAYNGNTVSGTTIAGKTGTTNLDSATKKNKNLKSNAIMEVWYVTYSPSHSIALWYGYDKIYDNATEKNLYLTSSLGSSARKQIMNTLATGIHKKNKTFKTPKKITTASIELETFPAQLCSEYTPSSMCVKEYFVSGAEPTKVSTRYSKLNTPTNGSYTFSGNTITIKWDPIATPDAINQTYLAEHFNEYYGKYATKYYDKRISYNASYIGTLGYQIYLKDSSGNETYLGYTNNNSFSYNVPAGGDYTFIVKSAYSIFKNNMSSGLQINTRTIDSGLGGIVDPSTPDTP